MNATAIAALAGTAIGAIAAIASALLAGYFSARNERLRLVETKRATDTADLRAATSVVFEEIFAVQHAMSWITWHAARVSTEIGADTRQEYQAQINRAYPRLLGALARVASLNLAIYEELGRVCERIYDLEEQVALAIHSLNGPPVDVPPLQSLARHLPSVHSLEKDLPRELARIMQLAAG